jgi:hypothetical protein
MPNCSIAVADAAACSLAAYMTPINRAGDLDDLPGQRGLLRHTLTLHHARNMGHFAGLLESDWLSTGRPPQALAAGLSTRGYNEKNDEGEHRDEDKAYRGEVLKSYRMARFKRSPNERNKNEKHANGHAFQDSLQDAMSAPRGACVRCACDSVGRRYVKRRLTEAGSLHCPRSQRR